ncbi:MAG TPA: NFACT family protein [Bdellovibrionota bacterium]|nr:NFACT family protein [Bdellovibrionota bacterium]
MFLHAADIGRLVEEIRASCLHGFVQKIHLIYPLGIQLTLRVRGATERLILIDDMRFPAAACCSESWKSIIQDESPFIQLTKKYLRDSKLTSIDQLDHDRIIKFTFGSTSLILECVERFANIYLIDSDRCILAAQQALRKPLHLHEEYTGPISTGHPEASPTIPLDQSPSEKILQGIRVHLIEEQVREEQKRLKREIEKRERLLEKLEDDFKQAQEAERLRKEGDLLKSVVHTISPRSTSVQVTDYETSPPAMVTIKLDPALSPHDQVKHLFQRYKKLKRACEEIQKRMELIQKELKTFQDQKSKINELVPGTRGLSTDLHKRLTPLYPAPIHLKKTKKVPAGGPRHFQSRDGFDIFVARNAKQGMELLRQAKGNDLWLHVLQSPGPHVIILRKKRKEIPHFTIVEGAALALFFSPLRKQGKGDVTVAERKYVKMLKGEEGKVTYSQSKTVAIKLDEERLEPILASQKGSK